MRRFGPHFFVRAYGDGGMFQHLTKFRVLSSGGKKIAENDCFDTKFSFKTTFLDNLTGSD